jgi:hypothetical protein
MGFGLRIAPGVRISASSRGLRAGVGPRVARVHVGSGRTGFSTGAGPLTYYTGGGRGGRTAGGSSVAAYERQVRAAQRQEEIQAIVDLDLEMVRVGSVHEIPLSHRHRLSRLKHLKLTRMQSEGSVSRVAWRVFRGCA